MKSLEEIIQRHKIETSNTQEREITSWQQFAIEICSRYLITGRFKASIFKMAKGKRFQYLIGKVANVEELKKIDPLKYKSLSDNKKLGNYLFATFRNKLPKK